MFDPRHRAEFLQEVKDVFFQGMSQGWVTGGEKQRDVPFPGAKCYTFTRGRFTLKDFFFVNSLSNSSCGSTVISWAGLSTGPVWMMQYGGWYKKEVMEFLKRVLARYYTSNVFYGGRGPIMFAGEDHMIQYLNNVIRNDFADFLGHESIIVTSELYGCPPGTIQGEHHYFGRALV